MLLKDRMVNSNLASVEELKVQLLLEVKPGFKIGYYTSFPPLIKCHPQMA
jgi:hypothetical protein